MTRPFLSVLVLLAPGCGPSGPTPLEQARATLSQALSTRDPQTVSEAARAASAFEGQDPRIDHLLGDALANVLMRPSDGLVLLRTNPQPSEPTWAQAYESAALRSGEAATLERAFRETGRPSIEAPADLIEWLSARALRDPHLSIDSLRSANTACELWDRAPLRGRRTVDQPTPPGFLEVLPSLGSREVVLGRAAVPVDPLPGSGDGLQPCASGRIWQEAAWPTPLPKHLTVAIATTDDALYLSVRPEAGAPWVFASTRATVAGELVAHARDVLAGAPASSTWLPDQLRRSPTPAIPPIVE